MKYYLHDTSSFEDAKISELYIKYGYEGLGLFYTFLEKVAKQEKPVKTDVLKYQLKIGKKLEKCWKFMEEIGLVSSFDDETFSERLLNFSEKYTIRKEKTRERVSEWRGKQALAKDGKPPKGVCDAPKAKGGKVYIYPDFLEFKTFAFENQPETDLKKLELKFKSWVMADWHNGKGSKIKNWKSTLLNTLSFLKNETNRENNGKLFESDTTARTIESIKRGFNEIKNDNEID
jgi:hypothetical protein